jgi:hypothetical protein
VFTDFPNVDLFVYQREVKKVLFLRKNLFCAYLKLCLNILLTFLFVKTDCSQKGFGRRVDEFDETVVDKTHNSKLGTF